jgi:hypothetical protein
MVPSSPTMLEDEKTSNTIRSAYEMLSYKIYIVIAITHDLVQAVRAKLITGLVV